MTTLKVLVIPVDHPPRVAEIDPNLTSFREIVGGHIEALSLHYPEGVMWFNEEGKLLMLPLNSHATLIATLQRSGIAHDDFIAGTAFITGQDDEGNATDVHPVYLRRYLPE